MAESENGATAPAGEVPMERHLVINAQYVKDLSFENPRAPHSLLQQTGQPEVNLGVDVKAQNLAPNVFEVVLTVSTEAKIGSDSIFVVELVYGAVVTLQNVPEEAIPVAVLIEAPRQMFPFARSIIANATRDGGYPPLLVHPIDFAELLHRQQQMRATEPTASGAGTA